MSKAWDAVKSFFTFLADGPAPTIDVPSDDAMAGESVIDELPVWAQQPAGKPPGREKK